MASQTAVGDAFSLKIAKRIAISLAIFHRIQKSQGLWGGKKTFGARRSLRFFIGKIQTGAYKRGLKPQIFRENRAKILPGKSGLFGPDWSLFRPYRGLFGADWDRFLRTSQPRGGSKNSPERAFLGPIGAFWAKPPFAKPPFGFPQLYPASKNRNRRDIASLGALSTQRYGLRYYFAIALQLL